VRIVNAIRAHGKSSSRRLAERTRLSTSSGHRQLRAAGHRDRYPESGLWKHRKAEPGHPPGCCHSLSRWPATRRWDRHDQRVCRPSAPEAHLGCSPGALRRLTQRWERTSRKPVGRGHKRASSLARSAPASGRWTQPLCRACGACVWTGPVATWCWQRWRESAPMTLERLSESPAQDAGRGGLVPGQ